LARTSKRRRLPSAGTTGTAGKNRPVRLTPIRGIQQEIEFTGQDRFVPRGITRTGAVISGASSPWFVALDRDRKVTRIAALNLLDATIRHLRGIEHTKLTDRFQGPDLRLTEVHGKGVKAILS
jgi:hypothetical protein